MKIQQFVITAYLNNPIEEEIYMQVPKFFDDILKFIIEIGNKHVAFTLKVENN